MARIKNIQTPDGVIHTIVPEQLQSGTFTAALPQLTSNATIATTADLQDISVNAVEQQYTKSTSDTQVSTVTTWSTITTSSSQRERSVTYGNGYWVVAGASGDLWYSTDAATWTKATAFASGIIIGVVYGNGYFLASCHDDHTIYKATTPVGPWTALVTLAAAFESIQYINNTFVATGENGLISFSATGEVWHNAITGVTNAFYAAAYGLGQYIVVGSEGKILSSVNGETWTDVSSPSLTTDIRTVTFGNGRFIVGGKSIYYSTDAFTWTAATTIPEAISGWIRGFAYAEGRYYCGMYQSSGAGAIWYSIDGSNWISAYGNLNRVWCIGYGAGVFVASGDSGKIYTLDLDIVWSSTAPTLDDGEFLWSRVMLTQNNGSVIYSDAVLEQADRPIAIVDLTEL